VRPLVAGLADLALLLQKELLVRVDLLVLGVAVQEGQSAAAAANHRGGAIQQRRRRVAPVHSRDAAHTRLSTHHELPQLLLQCVIVSLLHRLTLLLVGEVVDVARAVSPRASGVTPKCSDRQHCRAAARAARAAERSHVAAILV
jgi:hypothetical protein